MTSSKYFSGCKSKQELKTKYKMLLKKHHPDNGGDLVIMQEINAEYAALYIILPDCAKSSDNVETDMRDEKPTLSPALESALRKISGIPGIEIEVCGNWIWVSGNTYPVRETLKAAGFMFSGKKKMWYFREQEKYVYRKHKSVDMESIRVKYGSNTVHRQTACLA